MEKKKIYIRDLEEHIGEEIDEIFFVSDYQANYNRQGNSWIKVFISDKTGSRTAKIWSEFSLTDISSDMEKYSEKVCKVHGKVDLYNGIVGLAITKIEPITEFDPSELTYELDNEVKDHLKRELTHWIEKVNDVSLKKLLSKVFADSNVAKLLSLPGSGGMHHRYNGGLMVHILEVTDIAFRVAGILQSYSGYGTAQKKERIDMDLVIAGSLLHDVGYITCLRPLPIGGLSNRGRLMGHIAESVAFVTAYNLLLKKNERVADTSELNQIILSSYGEEGGTVPATPEAVIVYHAEKMSAESDGIFLAFADNEKKHPGSNSEFVYSKAHKAYVHLRGGFRYDE